MLSGAVLSGLLIAQQAEAKARGVTTADRASGGLRFARRRVELRHLAPLPGVRGKAPGQSEGCKR